MVTSTQISSSSSQQKSPSSTPLSKRLKGWPKKRQKLQPSETPIIAESSATPRDEYPIIDPLVLRNVSKETRWAAIWLSRLQPGRKNTRKNDSQGTQSSRVRPTVMTLAEQLREAQLTPLSVPNSNVPPSPYARLMCRDFRRLKFSIIPLGPKNSSRDFRDRRHPQMSQRLVTQRHHRFQRQSSRRYQSTPKRRKETNGILQMWYSSIRLQILRNSKGVLNNWHRILKKLALIKHAISAESHCRRDLLIHQLHPT